MSVRLGLAVVLSHREEESAVHVGETIPRWIQYQSADALLSLVDADRYVDHRDLRHGFGGRIPAVEPDELDHERVSRGSGHSLVEGFGLDAGASILDGLRDGEACRLGVEPAYVVARASLHECRSVVRFQHILELWQGGTYEGDWALLASADMLHYGAELPDLVDVGAQQFVKGDDQAGASVGESVAERGQHPTEVFGGPGPGPL